MINESVILAARQFGCLNEMFVEGRRNLQHGSIIIAYKSKIWVLPPDSSGDVESTRMRNSIAKEIQGPRQGKKWRPEGITSFEERPDVLVAHYNKIGKSATLDIIKGLNYQHNMDTSPLVAKVAKTLGVVEVMARDNQGNLIQSGDAKTLKPKSPDYGYHGTNSAHLDGILRRGIMPKPNQTNFDFIKHSTVVFFTLDPDKAIFHAGQAVRTKDETKHRSGYGGIQYKKNEIGQSTSQMIVLRVKIPDPNLIVADYDIDTESSQANYKAQRPHDLTHRATMPGDSKKLSERLGVFGYKGRILPQQITDIWIRQKDAIDAGSENSIRDFAHYSMKEVAEPLRELLQLSDDMGGELFDNTDLIEYLNNPEAFLEQYKSEEDADAE